MFFCWMRCEKVFVSSLLHTHLLLLQRERGRKCWLNNDVWGWSQLIRVFSSRRPHQLLATEAKSTLSRRVTFSHDERFCFHQPFSTATQKPIQQCACLAVLLMHQCRPVVANRFNAVRLEHQETICFQAESQVLRLQSSAAASSCRFIRLHNLRLQVCK